MKYNVKKIIKSMMNIHFFSDDENNVYFIFDSNDLFDLEDVNFLFLSKNIYQTLFLSLKKDILIYTPINSQIIRYISKYNLENVIVMNCKVEDYDKNDGKLVSFYIID